MIIRHIRGLKSFSILFGKNLYTGLQNVTDGVFLLPAEWSVISYTINLFPPMELGHKLKSQIQRTLMINFICLSFE